MKKLGLILIVFAFAACQKDEKLPIPQQDGVTSAPNKSKGEIEAKIDGRQWKSSSSKNAAGSEYLAAFSSGLLQIKTFGSFTDSTGVTSDDQLAIYVENCSDTGVYFLDLSSYIVYNQLSQMPKYFSTQEANSGRIYITSLTDSTVSGSFECRVDNTAGEGSFFIKEGSFSNVKFQK